MAKIYLRDEDGKLLVDDEGKYIYVESEGPTSTGQSVAATAVAIPAVQAESPVRVY